MASSGRTVTVWDIGIRLFHWGLLAAVVASAWTGFVAGRTALAWHLIGGAVVAGLLLWRLVWGWLGSRYARFTSFAYGPRQVTGHVRDLWRRGGHRHLGHNPLGAAMVFALLAVLAALTLTGTLTLGGLLKQGPLRAFLPYAFGVAVRSLHSALAIMLLAMVGLHLCGVLFESWRGQENLTAAMLTGDKRADPAADPERRPAAGRPLLANGLATLLLLVGAGGVAALAALPGRGVPPVAQDPVYAEQCGACHLAYPPSLAPAATWDAILGDLQHHFGQDATLSAEQVATIRAWVDANDAARWDTLASHVLRVPAADGSRRLTDTPGWRRLHRHIADAVFASEAVGGRSSCEACHGDAANGRFAPQRIAIPRQ